MESSAGSEGGNPIFVLKIYTGRFVSMLLFGSAAESGLKSSAGSGEELAGSLRGAWVPTPRVSPGVCTGLLARCCPSHPSDIERSRTGDFNALSKGYRTLLTPQFPLQS